MKLKTVVLLLWVCPSIHAHAQSTQASLAVRVSSSLQSSGSAPAQEYGDWRAKTPRFPHLQVRAKCDYAVEGQSDSMWSFDFKNDYAYPVDFIYRYEYGAPKTSLNKMSALGQDSLDPGEVRAGLNSSLHGTCDNHRDGIHVAVLCVVPKGQIASCYTKYGVSRPVDPKSTASRTKSPLDSKAPGLSATVDPDPGLDISVVAWNASGARIPLKWAIDSKDSMCRDSDIVDVSNDTAEAGDSTGMHPGSSSKSLTCPHGKYVCVWSGQQMNGPWSIPCQTKLIPQRFKADGKVFFVFDPVFPGQIDITHSVAYPFRQNLPQLTHQDESDLKCVGDRYQEPPNTLTDEQVKECIASAVPH